MRLLSAGHPDLGQGAARPQHIADARGNCHGARRQYLPLRQPFAHPARGRARRRTDAPRSPVMNTAGADRHALLADNPRLDQWVGFPAPGRVRVSTGRVEIGQGVLTAMRQIAADELDVSPERIDLLTGDTERTPTEGYTAGSQSIQFGGVALRLACAEVRDRFLDHVAVSFGHARGELSVRDGTILHRGTATGHNYWSLAGAVDLGRPATGSGQGKTATAHSVVGSNLPRVDL